MIAWQFDLLRYTCGGVLLAGNLPLMLVVENWWRKSRHLGV